MEDFQQRAGTSAGTWAGTLALPESRFATLGERIVQAARMAVMEHLRQEALQSHPMPIVVGGANHANGNDSLNHPGHLLADFRTSKLRSGDARSDVRSGEAEAA